MNNPNCPRTGRIAPEAVLEWRWRPSVVSGDGSFIVAIPHGARRPVDERNGLGVSGVSAIASPVFGEDQLGVSPHKNVGAHLKPSME
jgi:hypothetical protein